MSKIALLSTSPEPPSSLSDPGAKLWRSITKQYLIRDAGGLAILEAACIARDRAREYAATIKREGVMIRTATGTREHPLLKAEREERTLEGRLLTKLGLNLEAVRDVGRPAGRSIGVTLERFHDHEPDTA